MEPSQESSALKYSYRLLARRDYPVQILREKIQSKFSELQPEQIQTILNKLAEQGFLSDTKYATHFVSSRSSAKPMGRFRLTRELKQKKLPSAEIETALENLDEDSLALDAAKRKLKLLHEADPHKRKLKLFRFLSSRGFDYDTIQNTLDKIEPLFHETSSND